DFLVGLAAGAEDDELLVAGEGDEDVAGVEDAAAFAALRALVHPQLFAGLGVHAEEVAAGRGDAEDQVVLQEGRVVAGGGQRFLPHFRGGELVALLVDAQGRGAGDAAAFAALLEAAAGDGIDHRLPVHERCAVAALVFRAANLGVPQDLTVG